ncbi:MAG TPA: hypothetical protein VGN17_11725 [Bryobacteraceae bacterium]|jgi:hypothetical protein
MKHLNDDQLLDRFYGLSSSGENAHTHSHVDQCPECAGRLAAMELRRTDSAAETGASGRPISHDFLAQQRRAIYARIEQPANIRARWAPALAAATLLAVGVLMYHPRVPSKPVAHRTPAPVARPELSQEQLFSDVFSMEQASEPRAAAPIRALFEDQGSEQ